MSHSYSLPLRLVHWLTVGLVLAQCALALLNILLYAPRPILAEALVQAHISLGVVILLLTLGRLALRWRSPLPPRPAKTALRTIARVVHASLYGLLLLLPVSGYLRLAALGFDIHLFGFLPLPGLSLSVPLALWAGTVHDGGVFLLLGLVSLHVGAALGHRWIDGRAVLGHMTVRCAAKAPPK